MNNKSKKIWKQTKGQIIELKPNKTQITYFNKACGVARLAYNWALNEWNNQYKLNKEYRDKCKKLNIEVDNNKIYKPTENELRKQLNKIKYEKFPFMLEVTKCAPQLAIKQLGMAFSRFFKGQAKYPKFRKKGIDDKFSISNDQFKIENNKIKIPLLGWIKLKENLKLNGKLLSAKIFTRAGRWFVSVNVELSNLILPKIKTNKSVGIDLGIKDFAILSNGEKIQSPKPLKQKLKKLKRLNKSLSRKKLGSKNRQKAKIKLSKLHYKISCIRKDFLHKLTTNLLNRFDVIAIEDLNTKGMLKNHKLARAISDLGFYEFKRQLIYKAAFWNKTIKAVDRFFPSSKNCSVCNNYKKTDLTLKDREWTCPLCNTHHDRDINAAINILNNANKVLTL